jgi:hypothetical protein
MKYYRRRYSNLTGHIHATSAASSRHRKAIDRIIIYQHRYAILQQLFQCGFDEASDQKHKLLYTLLEQLIAIYQPWLKTS